MIIYLAGPIRPKGNQTLEGNLRFAKDVALALWKHGYVVICPHANSDLPYAEAEKIGNPALWLNGDLEMLGRCDVLVVLPDWEISEGTKGEIRFARTNGIPVYFYPDLPSLYETPLRWQDIKMAILKRIKCPICHGQGKGDSGFWCYACKGKGWVRKMSKKGKK